MNITQLARHLEHLDAWISYTDPEGELLGPKPGCPLVGDDRATRPYRLSQAAWAAFGSAVDHLRTLRAVVVEARSLPVYSPFTLIRGALENAAKAVWLLEPRIRKDRVARRLRLAYAEARNMDALLEVFTGSSARTLAQVHAEVIALRTGKVSWRPT